ncbi:MAG: hypothetical protein DRI44_02280 [Chlamydiae bacterium]|nr:MAG: hypothetical protein DRI44_02280 [Chlamydiota bacterium]
MQRKNVNRGYMTLYVWKNAILLYKEVCCIFTLFPYKLKRVATQEIASTDSVHRNIAEGYCRKSINEYLQFLNIAKASLGETVSGIYAYYDTNQINKEDFEKLDKLAYLIENQLMNLIKSLEKKGGDGSWNDCLMLMEKSGCYITSPPSTNPLIQFL